MCMNSMSADKPIRLVLFEAGKERPVVDEPFSSIEMAKFFLGTIQTDYQTGFITNRGKTERSFTSRGQTKN